MIGIPYIEETFKTVLTYDKVIKGRFFICTNYGQEINKINIAEIIEFVKERDLKDQKYPVALLMGLRTTGNFQYSGLSDVGNAYNTKEVMLAFLSQPQATGQNQTLDKLPNGQSAHTTAQTWHDMERCATDFMAALNKWIVAKDLVGTMYISENQRQEIIFFNGKGNDNVSGAVLKFYLNVNSGCEIENYPDDFPDGIDAPPVTDTHPSHPM